jgi:hypothetical protein
MPKRRTRKKPSRYADANTAAGLEAQRQAAFAAIRRLYCESLPLWRTCTHSYCRRHRSCGGEAAACLKRSWPLMPADVQAHAYEQVRRGGPRRVRSATHIEWLLRGYAPSNFVC